MYRVVDLSLRVVIVDVVEIHDFVMVGKAQSVRQSRIGNT